MSLPKVVLIGGPTASGKSAKALRLAQERGGWIINADSQQVYNALPILTDQPRNTGTIPHHLYGCVPYLYTGMTAALWQKMAIECIEAALTAGALPIVVGGTGFYIEALRSGLSPIPLVSKETRRTFAEKDTSSLFALLLEKDPMTAKRLTPADTQRIVHALCVLHDTGKPLSYWHTLPRQPVPYAFETHVSIPNVQKTHEQILHRFFSMIEEGVVEEVIAFAEQPHARESPLRHALGFRQFLAYVQGDISLEHCKATYLTACHQYAKRQRTWFRRYISD